MAKRPSPPKPRSPTAAALAHPLYRKRVVRSRKGKGSYDRKGKYND